MRQTRGDVKVIRRLSSAALALAALGAMAGPAWGQGEVTVGHSGWKWGNPQPQGNTLRNIEFAPGVGYASGEFGTLLRTDNGGRGLAGGPTRPRADNSHPPPGGQQTARVRARRVPR